MVCLHHTLLHSFDMERSAQAKLGAGATAQTRTIASMTGYDWLHCIDPQLLQLGPTPAFTSESYQPVADCDRLLQASFNDTALAPRHAMPFTGVLDNEFNDNEVHFDSYDFSQSYLRPLDHAAVVTSGLGATDAHENMTFVLEVDQRASRRNVPRHARHSSTVSADDTVKL